MDDSGRRRRRTATQPDTSPSKAGFVDESPYLSPSGRPMRQRSTANLRNASPPSVPAPAPSRPARSSRVQKKESSSPFEEEGDEEEEEYVEEEAMPSRSRRSTTRTRQSQPQSSPSAAAPPPAAPAPAKPPLRVTLGRNRGANRPQKRARLAEEEEAGWVEEVDDDDEAQIVYSTIIAKIQSWISSHPEANLSDFFDKVPTGTKVSLEEERQR
jgi:hypothetical protein